MNNPGDRASEGASDSEILQHDDRPTVSEAKDQLEAHVTRHGSESAVPTRLHSVFDRRVTFLLWVVLVTLIAVPLMYRSQSKVGPGTFAATLMPATSGTTQIAIPPFGALTARTHAAPVSLNFELREVDVLDAIDPTSEPGLAGIEDEIRSDLGSAVTHFALALLAVSASVGAVAAVTYPGRKSIGRTIVGAVLAPMVIAALVAPAGIDYDPTALETSPELTGPIGSAETLFAKVGSLNTRFGSVGSRAQVLSEKIAGLYSAATTDEIAKSDGEVALLHVSDLHLNSVGLTLAKSLADRFDVDAVIDTGDITSFGFKPEAAFVNALADFDIPYYVIPGNHDSEGVRRELAASPDVTYLDGDTARVGDIKILGIGDPTVTALRTIPQERIDRAYRAQFKTTEKLVATEKPDLLMVHNPVQIKPVLGEVPVAAAGHIHRTDLEVIDNTVVTIVGSSGATGVGNLLIEADEPYRFEILRFRDHKLVAVDEISLSGSDGDFTLQRHLIGNDEKDTTEDLPEADQQEPSRDEVESENPEILDEVTSSTTTSEIPGIPTTTAGAVSTSSSLPVATTTSRP